ncbi:MAG: ATP-binding protein [Thermodesulfobacteriota bacterium]
MTGEANSNGQGEGRKAQRPYRALTRNMVLFVVMAAIIPLIITGLVTLGQFSSSYEQKVRDHLRELVQKHRQSIETYLSDRLGDIRFLARTTSLADLTQESFLRQRLQLLREEFGGAFVDLGVVASGGRQVAYAGPFKLEGADYARANWFLGAWSHAQYISDVFSGLRGTPHFIIAVKQNFTGPPTPGSYLVRATIDFEAFNALVEKLSLGKTGFAFIINRRGQFQTKPRYGVDLTRGIYKDLLDGHLNPRTMPVLERPDAGGRQTIYTMAPLKGGDWILCLQQAARDAYADMYATVALAIGIILLTAVVIVVLAFPLSRRLVSRLEQADRERAVMGEKVIETGRLASIGELASGIAHEINNPVAIMVEEAGWIEDILAEEKPVSEEDLGEIQRAVQQIRTQGARCKDITYKLLSFARKTDPTPKEVDLNELVEEVVGLLSQKSRWATVTLETKLDPALPRVKASPSELQQVILNLMNNAVDAMGKGGGLVTVSTRREGGRVQLLVSDTGQGIPEALLPRIFDPFFTTKPVGHGTGLGLSICYGIVDKLGGEITVRSEVGKGTTFLVGLPAWEGGEQQPQSTTASAPAAKEAPVPGADNQGGSNP